MLTMLWPCKKRKKKKGKQDTIFYNDTTEVISIVLYVSFYFSNTNRYDFVLDGNQFLNSVPISQEFI